MRSSRRRLVALAALSALTVLPAPAALANRTRPPGPLPGVTEKDFALERFSAGSIDVTNRFMPLSPGLAYTLTGTANRGAGTGSHEVVFTVTGVTKWVNHIRAVALWDRDYQDGVLVEEELAFMAQDDQGNIWNMGEYPEEIDENGVISTPSVWLAGHQNAITGLLVQAEPKPHTASFLQGDAPAIGFLDQASVSKANQKVCGPTGCYTGVVVVDEFDPSAQPQDGHQFKYHAPGVGVVQIVGKRGIEQETLVLTERRTLTPAELAAANERTLKLDHRAYLRAPAVWQGTASATLR